MIFDHLRIKWIPRERELQTGKNQYKGPDAAVGLKCLRRSIKPGDLA